MQQVWRTRGNPWMVPVAGSDIEPEHVQHVKHVSCLCSQLLGAAVPLTGSEYSSPYRNFLG